MTAPPPPRCHLLRLPSETLHSICGFLEDDGLRTELANLRLTSRALREVPEEYLFRRITLDSCFDSLENLQQVSQHHRLSQYVYAVEVDILFRTETLTMNEYYAKVASYGSLEPEQEDGEPGSEDDVESQVDMRAEDDSNNDEEDEWPPKSRYDNLLAQERDSLTPDELTACWERCRRMQEQQTKLKAAAMEKLLDLLRTSLETLPNLVTFRCEALGVRQYEWDVDGNSKLNDSQRRTLLPPVYSHVRDQEAKDAVVTFSAACIGAILLADTPLYALHLSRIPWDAFLELPTFFNTDAALPTLDVLKLLDVNTHTWRLVSDEDKFRGMAFIADMLAVAPDVETFEWQVGTLPDCPLTVFDLPDRHFLSRSPQLRKLTIGVIRTTCSMGTLQNFLVALPSHLQHLELLRLSLQDGAWVDIFQLLHTRLRLQKFSFDELVEHDPAGGKVHRWLKLYQEQPVRGSLSDRLIDFVTRKTATSPLLPTALGGSPELWKSKCDASLLYDTIADGH